MFLTHTSGGDPDLYIYDTNLNSIGGSSNGGGEDEVVTVPAAGTYYARVYVFNENTGSDGVNYSLDIPEPVGAGTYDDTSGSIIYGAGWSHGTGFARAYLSTMSWTYADRATAQLTFIGSRITRRYKMGPQRGAEWIAIDDDFPSYSSAGAPTTRWRVGQTWMLPYGVHTIEVSADGTQGSDLDAFVVDIPYAGLGTYDNTYYQISYIGSGWLHGSFPGAYQGTLSYSGTAEDAVVFTFFGDCVTYYYTRAPGRGKAAITIDGNDRGYLDLYAPAVQYQSYNSFCGLGDSIHTLHISVSGQKNPASSGYAVDVDALNVSPPG